MPDLFTPTNPPVDPATPPLVIPTPSAPVVEHHLHALAAFCQNPVNISFQTQEPDEEILLFLRRHFVTNVPWIATTIFFAILPFIIGYVLSLTATVLPISQNAINVFIIFYYLIVFAYAYINFLSWFYNISFVTTKRVVDIDFSELVYKNVAATKLSLVQDVSYSQIGVIRSLFDYGDVLVQTAGAMDNFDLSAVPQPERVVSIIENLIGRRPRVL